MLESQEFRVSYFPYDFFAFCIYYFWNNMILWIKDFHKEIMKIASWDRNALIIWFRECGKTAIVALWYVIYCIATKKEKFVLFMAYDLDSATEKVNNIITILKTNKILINDYWLLFDDGTSRKQNLTEANKQKTMNKFVSTNGVKVQAVSLKNMKRWKQFVDDEWNVLRPSLLIWDDIDIEESVKNERIIEENFYKISSWVLNSIRWRAIFLWNIIAEDGVNIRLRDEYCKNNDIWNYKEIALLENDEIVWEEKYVWTHAEAQKINKEKYDGEKMVTSIEELQINPEAFNSDYLNKPRIVIWDPVFNTENVLKLEEREPVYTYNMKIDDREIILDIFYEDFKKDYFDYLYAGIDTAGGQGGESDSSDLTFLDKDGNLYARINSNILNYKHLYKLLHILHNDYWFHFFNNSLCIERNYMWVALIEELKQDNPHVLLSKCYIPTSEWKKHTKYTNIVGWNTTHTSKEQMKDGLDRAINLWKLQIDTLMKKELKWWTREEVNGKIIYAPDGVNVKHDDSIISYGLALQMFLNYNPNFLDYEHH